jgi:hypothetical protein
VLEARDVHYVPLGIETLWFRYIVQYCVALRRACFRDSASVHMEGGAALFRVVDLFPLSLILTLSRLTTYIYDVPHS